MPERRIMYIEQKTDGGHNLDDRGPAFIDEVSFSKSGKTIYWQGRTYTRNPNRRSDGNYVCEETGDEYWITGVKKRGTNRRYSRLPVTDLTDKSAWSE